jgi:hypothetical protein
VNVARLEPAALADDLGEFPKLDVAKALERIDRESPELAAAATRVRQWEQRVRRAEVEKIPDLFVRGGIRNNRGFGEIGPFGPTQRRGIEGIFDVGVEIPIFNRNQGGVKAAKAEAEAARLDVERTRLALRVGLANVLQDYRSAATAAGSYRERILAKARQSCELYLANFLRGSRWCGRCGGRWRSRGCCWQRGRSSGRGCGRGGWRRSRGTEAEELALDDAGGGIAVETVLGEAAHGSGDFVGDDGDDAFDAGGHERDGDGVVAGVKGE